MKPHVFVVVLNWNRAEDTIACLESIANLSTNNYQLTTVVVDNASTDNSVAKIKNQISKSKDTNEILKILENTKNLGYAGGNNVGISYALKNGADYVMILNNDTSVQPSLIVRTVELAQKDSKIGLISPKIYFAKGYEFHKEMYKENDKGRVIWYAGGKIDWDNVYGSGRGVDEVDEGQYNKAEETDFATGTCLFLTRKLLEKVGVFDEKYFMYYEDTDLSVRAKKSGLKVIYFPDAIVWHKVAQSSAIGSPLNDYYTTRNRMLFGIRYAPSRTKFALLRESIKLLLTGRKWQKIGIKDYYLGRFGRGSWK